MPDSNIPELDAIRPPSNAAPAPQNEQEGEASNQSDLDFEKESSTRTREEIKYLQLQNAKLQEEVHDTQQNRQQRVEYASKVFNLVCAWLYGLGILIMMDGAKMLALKEKVLIALITGTSINVIALMAVVIRYLFPQNGTAANKN